MNKYKQIEILFRDTALTNNARKLCNNRDIYNDLLQETFIYLLEMPDEKFDRINNLKAFAFTVMFGKSNSQARNYNLNGKDNVLFEMSSKFGQFDVLCQSLPSLQGDLVVGSTLDLEHFHP